MAHSRLSDPPTSHAAAEAIERSGCASRHRLRCLAQVRRTPGMTAAEIARVIGLEHHAPSRRLPELRDAGLVINGPARICVAKSRLSLTWYPQEALS